MSTKPEIGSTWKHSNGNIYKVLMFTNEHSHKSAYPVTIVHQGINGCIWSRPLVDWSK